MSTLNTTNIAQRLNSARGTPAYDALLGFIIQNSDVTSFDGQLIRHVYRHVWPFFVLLCVAIIICGTYMNVRYFLWLLSRGERHKPSQVYHIRAFAYLINGIICDLLKLLIVFPLSVCNLLLRFYRLGETTCFLLPLLQYLTIYVPILIYLSIALECSRAAALHRVEWRVCSMPVFAVSFIIWLVACGLVTPYLPYLHYVDIGANLGAPFDGIGLCVVHKSDRRVTEVIRIAFVILFVAPLAAAGYLTMTSEAESEMNIMFQRSLSTRATAAAAAAANDVTQSISARDNNAEWAHQQSIQISTHDGGKSDILPTNNKMSSDNNGHQSFSSKGHVEGGVVIHQSASNSHNKHKNQKRSRKSKSRRSSAAEKQSNKNLSSSSATKGEGVEIDESDQSDIDDDEEELQDAEHLNSAMDEVSRRGGGGPEVRMALYKCHSDGRAKRFTALGERKFSATLGRMIALFSLLNLPLQLVMIAHYFVPQQSAGSLAAESDGFSSGLLFDYLYLVFIPIAFLSTFINPLMVAATMTEQKSYLSFIY